MQETIPVEDIEKYKVATPEITRHYTDYVGIKEVVNTTGQEAQSWACVNELGNILIGRNQEISVGGSGDGTRIDFALAVR